MKWQAEGRTTGLRYPTLAGIAVFASNTHRFPRAFSIKRLGDQKWVNMLHLSRVLFVLELSAFKLYYTFETPTRNIDVRRRFAWGPQPSRLSVVVWHIHVVRNSTVYRWRFCRLSTFSARSHEFISVCCLRYVRPRESTCCSSRWTRFYWSWYLDQILQRNATEVGT